MSSNLQTASTVLKNISQSVIAALMYDIALQDMPESDIDAAESIFYESIDIASEGILSSRRTKERMLRTLQRQKLSIIINKFKKDGKPVRIIILRNAFRKLSAWEILKKLCRIF